MGWTNFLSNKGIMFSTLFFGASYIIFQGNIYGPVWIVAAIAIIIFSLTMITDLSKSWKGVTEKTFIKKLFWYSLLFRLITMLVLLMISLNTEGWRMFYYVGARDPQKYFRVAWEASKIWSDSNIADAYQYILQSYYMDISDTGFSLFLSIPIHFLGLTPFLLKVFLCIIGSIVVVRGYKLATLLFEQQVARLAAILIMLYPVSWFYSGVLLKESLMILLITEALILIIRIQRTFSIYNLLKVLFIVILIFFFRSAISILLVMVLLVSLFFQYKKKNIVINIIAAIIITTGYLYFLKSTGRYEEYYQQYTDTEVYSESRISYMESINPFVGAAGTPVFAALAFIAPFPSIVTVPVEGGLSHNEYYYHVAGNLYWIILAFFSLFGIYYVVRYKREEMAPIWSFIIGYQIILLKAMMFTSVRFSYLAKPFLLILAAYGIFQLKSKKWYPVYLAGAFLLILGWNYVRFKGRS